jgi:hypothetical protein
LEQAALVDHLQAKVSMDLIPFLVLTRQLVVAAVVVKTMELLGLLVDLVAVAQGD